jgi:hypothetical protein
MLNHENGSSFNKIIMFHSARSGSTVLGDLLGQHPQIRWDGEIYAPPTQKPSPRLLNYLIKDPIKLLSLRMRFAHKKYYGFETQFIHLDIKKIALTDFVAALKQMGFAHFIILKRKNYLRLIVSALIAQQASQWHQPAGQQARLNPATINLEQVFGPNGLSLLGTLEYVEERFQAVEQLLADQKVLQLTYEGHISNNPLLGYQEICRFLEVEPDSTVSVRYSKTNPFSLGELIANFGEVEQALQGTQFAWMLDE